MQATLFLILKNYIYCVALNCICIEFNGNFNWHDEMSTYFHFRMEEDAS